MLAHRGGLFVLTGAALLQCVFARLPWLHRESDAITEVPDTRGKELPCKNMVQRAPVVFPKELMLGNQRKFPMYSGYVNVTHEDYLFYWFVEASNRARDDAPLILWSNGGPGCSGMEGATTESGPYVLHDVKENHMMFTGRLSHNPYSWNERAHVLYVDQPRYVGFSCGTGPKVMSSREAGKDIVRFLLGWREVFPEHRHRDIIFASESYGGHYVPAWTHAVMEYNKGASEPLRLKGIALGNAKIDEKLQGTEQFVTFLQRHQLLPSEGKTPATIEEARDLMQQHLGYKPNFYNYGLVNVDCCGCYSYNYSTWGNWLMKKEVLEALNVCGDAGANTFGGCHGGCMDGMVGFDADDDFDYVGTMERALEEGIKVTMMYGMMDTACDYVGGYNVATRLEWYGAKRFRDAPLLPLKIEGDIAGAQQSSDGLTWVQILGAGHMVEADNPAASSYAIDTLILEIRNPDQDLFTVAKQLAADSDVDDHPVSTSLPQERWVLLTLVAFVIGGVATGASRWAVRPTEGADDGCGYVRVEA